MHRFHHSYIILWPKYGQHLIKYGHIYPINQPTTKESNSHTNHNHRLMQLEPKMYVHCTKDSKSTVDSDTTPMITINNNNHQHNVLGFFYPISIISRPTICPMLYCASTPPTRLQCYPTTTLPTNLYRPTTQQNVTIIKYHPSLILMHFFVSTLNYFINTTNLLLTP